MMIRALLTLNCWLLWVAACLGQEAFAPRTFTAPSGGTLPYRLLSPEKTEPGRKYPLVLFFHGAGERGANNLAQLKNSVGLFARPEQRRQFPAFVLAPQCPDGQQWVDMPWGTDSGTRPERPSRAMALALGALAQVQAEFPVDPERIYVSGLSMGGYATWDCLTRFPERFAAGVPVCGGGDEKTVTPAMAKVPVWAFHSEDDGVVKTRRTRGMVQAMRTLGGTPKYFEYFGLGHNSWDAAFAEPELLPWLFSQRLGQPDTVVLKTPAPKLPAVAEWPVNDEIFPGQGPVQKGDWFKALWRERRLKWWFSRAKDKGAVVFLGDSITQGWGSLAKDFAGMKVVNRGISGDVTRGIRYRLPEDVLTLDPLAVVLLIGTNDLGLGGTPEQTADNLKAILQMIQAQCPNCPVILCQVMPRTPEFADRIRKLNALLDGLTAGNPKLIRCDTWSLFATAEGGAKKGEFPDLLHPNAAGYAKWAAALKPIFQAQNLLPK
jgi:lysophospholipase L1-like esterase/poly(3-hydroxybutyrate) depolymerase